MMRIWTFALTLVTAVLVAGPQGTLAQEHEGRHDAAGQHAGNGQNAAADELPLCPVMGEPVNLAVSVATDEGPVYFCCDDCVPKYKAHPEKYADKVAAQRTALAHRPKVQTVCPVSGKPVDTEVFIEKNGQKVYFCCKGCIGKYEAHPETYAKTLANSYTYQTRCPVMGGEIDPQAFVRVAGGRKIYFCCKGCEDKLFADPAKYLPNLAAQGISISPDQMKREAAQDDGRG
jgi:YHS domain-containing protein